MIAPNFISEIVVDIGDGGVIAKFTPNGAMRFGVVVQYVRLYGPHRDTPGVTVYDDVYSMSGVRLGDMGSVGGEDPSCVFVRGLS